MKNPFLFIACIFCALASCKLMSKEEPAKNNKALARVLNDYYEDRLQVFPLEATVIGDNRYNDRLPVDFTDSYRDTLSVFYNHYLVEIKKFDREKLAGNDAISYDIFKREMEMNLEGLQFHSNYIPFSQFSSLPLQMGQLGSGEGSQPFHTLKDHMDWIRRAKLFSVWADSAILYFRKGMASGYVLPRLLVVKMIPQMDALVITDPEKNLFWGPVHKLPAGADTARMGFGIPETDP